MSIRKLQQGVSLVEVLVVLAITLVVAALVFGAFANYTQSKSFDANVARIVALLEQARSQTLAAYNDIQYGVHFQTDKAVLFQGATYSAGASTNRQVSIDGLTTISNINLNGGGSDVIFERLTGATNQYGTTTLTHGTTTAQIVIYKTGLVEVK